MNPAVRTVVAIVVVALGVAAVVSRATAFSDADLVRNEFTQDYVSARALADGADPYAPAQTLMDRYLDGRPAYVIRNPHPPAQIMLVRPFGGLPYKVARAIWLLLQAIAIAAAIAIVVRSLGASRAAAAVAGVGALAIPVAQKELVYGNLNGILLLLMAIGWRALRDDRQARAGVALGAAAAIKLLPVFMIVPLLRMRRVRGSAWMVATGLAVTVLGFALAGFEHVAGFRGSLDENAVYWRAAPINVSLIAVPYRWLANSTWHEGVVNAPGIAATVALLLALACLIGAARTPAATSRDEYWAATPWMVLAAPLAWDWYLVLALPLAVVVIANAVRERRPPGAVAGLGIALLAIGALPGLPEPGRPMSAATLVLGYGLPTIALALMCVVDLRARRPLTPAGRPAGDT